MVMTEIAREAAICQVCQLLDPGVIEAVLHGNASVGNDNPRAFKKMRIAHDGFVMREKAFDSQPVEADALVSAIREAQRPSSATGSGGASGS